MAILLQDDFNRADSTNVLGSPQVGGPYTVRTGTWGINVNRAYTSASTADAQVTAPGAFNIDISADLAAGSNGSIMFRWVDAANYYAIQFNAGNVSLVNARTAGSLSLSGPTILSAPMTLRVVAYAEWIYAYLNGKNWCAWFDPYTATSPSVVGLRNNSSTIVRWDNLLAQDAAGPPDSWSGVDTRLYKGRDTAALDLAGVA